MTASMPVKSNDPLERIARAMPAGGMLPVLSCSEVGSVSQALRLPTTGFGGGR